MLDDYIQKFQLTDNIEMDLVHEMVAAKWRQARAAKIETEYFDKAATAGEAFDANCNKIGAVQRYAAGFRREYSRALKELLDLRKHAATPPEAEPASEPEPATQPEPPAPSQPDPEPQDAEPRFTTSEFARLIRENSYPITLPITRLR